MPDHSNEDSEVEHYPIVGRDDRIDLQRYTTHVHGRDIIDYEKLRREDPKLHAEIVREEVESDRREREDS